MKILILANSSKGVYSFRNELMQKILEKYELVISVPDDVCRKELEDEGCKVVYTPINRRGVNPKEDLGLVKEYKRLLKEEKPDLVMTYTIKPNIYGGWVCKKMKIPYFVTITGLGSTFQKENMMKKLVTTMYKAGIKASDCVFFQNRNNMEIFEEAHISGKKTKLVNGSGVNLEAHPYEEYPNNDKINILFMSRILKEKGVEEFLSAAKALASEKVEFGVLGKCEDDYEDMLAEYEKNGYIVNYGFQKDVNPYLKNCSALVLPSYYPEGISNVLMEASATGRPILTTNMPGCRDVVDDGKTGFIFEPQDEKSIIEAIEKFLKLSQTEREEMGKNARNKMECEFDRRKVIQDYMTEIDKILKG